MSASVKIQVASPGPSHEPSTSRQQQSSTACSTSNQGVPPELELAHCIVEGFYQKLGSEYTRRIFVLSGSKVGPEMWQTRLFGPFDTKQQALAVLELPEEPAPTRRRATTAAEKAHAASYT
jgi:hypothetical protein